MPASTCDVIVVGAGIIGLACAYELSRAGAHVRILDQHTPGAGQSTRTGGGIRLSHGSEINVALSKASLPTWREFETQFGVDPRYRETGHLFVTTDAECGDQLRRQAVWHRREDVPTEVLTDGEIKARWPHLGALECAVGSHCQIGGYLDDHSVVLGYLRGALNTGCDIRPGTRVEGMLVAGGRVEGVATSDGEHRAGLVINAAGAAAGIIAAMAGLSVPFRSRRHELLIVRPASSVLDNTPWLIDLDRQVHLRPDGQGRALIGGFLGKDKECDPQYYAREFSHGWARRVRAAASEAFGLCEPDCEIVEGWAGLYPGTIDYLPVIETSLPGLITAAGFSGTGLMHAPAVGQMVNDLAHQRAPEGVDISVLSASRFATGKQVAEATGF